MENERRVKALISVISCPGKTLATRIVRWRLGQRMLDGKVDTGKQGAITVDIPKNLVGNAADQAAELAALHDLLVNREVLGQGRGGNGLIIQVSHGAIRKMVLWYKQVCGLPIAIRKEALGRKIHGLDLNEMNGEVSMGDTPQFGSAYLTPYGRFLFGRFADADIVISKDIKWITPIVKPSLDSSLVLGRDLPDIIYAGDPLGYVEITTHALERSARRKNGMSHQEAWRSVANQLKSGHLRRIDRTYANQYNLSLKFTSGIQYHSLNERMIYAFAPNGKGLRLNTILVEQGQHPMSRGTN